MTTTTTPEERAAAVEVLRRVEERIAAGWTRHVLARDRRGHEVVLRDPNVCRVCLIGAFMLALPDDTTMTPPVALAEKAVAKVVGDDYLARWQDTPNRKKSEVLAAVRAARESLESQPE